MKKGTFGLIVMILILLAVFGYALLQIINITSEYRNGEDSYVELEQFVSMPEIREEPAVVEETEPAEDAAEEPTESEPEKLHFDVQWPDVDFEALAKVNEDVVGWIYIPGTVINYPVVQGSDNKYYLNHLFNGSRNSSGCIFMDYYVPADFSAMNSSIHGHHMRNGSMFAGICKYKNQSYYDQHPLGLLLTPDGNYVVQFFSGYACKSTSDAWSDSFEPEEFQRWLDKRLEKSAFACEVTPTAEDRVLTLSTCTYEFKDARFVLHGLLIPA